MTTYPASLTINLHPLKNASFVGEPRHIAKLKMSANAHRLMALICSEFGSNGHIEFTLERIGTFLERSKRTATRVINELVSNGLIQAQRTGRSLMFFLTDIVYGRIKKPLEKPPQISPEGQTIKQPETDVHNYRVDKNGYSESPKMATHTIYKEKTLKKGTANASPVNDKTEPDDEIGNRENQALPVIFSKKIDDKLGDFAESVKKSCDIIEKHPAKPGKPVNTHKMVAWCVKKRFHHKAIANAFKTMSDVNVWQGIGNPYAWLQKALKSASANFNELDHIRASNDLKNDEKMVCNYLNRLFAGL